MIDIDTEMKDRPVFVTGADGFVGSHLVNDLWSRSNDVEMFVPRSYEYDLCERTAIRQAFTDYGADTVIHLATTVGASVQTETI